GQEGKGRSRRKSCCCGHDCCQRHDLYEEVAEEQEGGRSGRQRFETGCCRRRCARRHDEQEEPQESQSSRRYGRPRKCPCRRCTRARCRPCCRSGSSFVEQHGSARQKDNEQDGDSHGFHA